MNFWIIESRWFAGLLAIGYLRAACNVLLGLLEGGAFLLFVAFLFAR